MYIISVLLKRDTNITNQKQNNYEKDFLYACPRIDFDGSNGTEYTHH